MAKKSNFTKFNDEALIKLALAKQQIRELRESLKFTEFILAKTKAQNVQLSNAVQETDDLNKKLEASLEFQVQKMNQSDKAAESLFFELKQREQACKDLELRIKVLEASHSQQISELYQKIESLEQAYQMSQQQVCTFSYYFQQTKSKIHQMLLHSKEQLSDDLFKQVADPEAFPKRLIRVISLIPKYKDDLNRFQLDNIKLFQVINSTKGLKSFGTLSQDSGGLTFVPSDYYRKKSRICHTSGEWLPEKVFKILKQSKSSSSLPSPVINGMLGRLNQAWMEREANRIQRIKYKYQQQILKLKKQVASLPQSPKLGSSQKTKSVEYSSKKIQNILLKVQQEFIEFLCDAVEEFCEMLEENPDSLRSSQEWLVDTVITFLNSYTNKLIESILQQMKDGDLIQMVGMKFIV